MKSKSKAIFIITFAMALNLVLFQNCGAPEVAFEALKPNTITETPLGGEGSDGGPIGGGSEEPSAGNPGDSGNPGDGSNPGGGDNPATKLIAEDLGIQRSDSKQLDIIWVIDNSGSMSEEAAHVRANYEKFVNSLSNDGLIKSALISRRGNSGTNVMLPAGLDPNLHIQIDYGVGSRDGMCIMQSSLFTEQEIDGATTDASAVCRTAPELSLNGFLRESSQKIVIFVTDDNEGLTYPEFFLSIFRAKYPDQNPIVYSYVAISKQDSPCRASVGTRYMDLTNMTKGKIYNICETDWTQNFSDMTNHVIESVQNSFSLKYNNITEILEVKVDDRVIDPAYYNVKNGLLTIDKSQILDSSARIKVKYTIP